MITQDILLHLIEISIGRKIHAIFFVDEVENFDAENYRCYSSDIFVSQMSWLCHPQEGQQHKNESICAVVTLLLPAIDHLEQAKQRIASANHERRNHTLWCEFKLVDLL